MYLYVWECETPEVCEWSIFHLFNCCICANGKIHRLDFFVLFFRLLRCKKLFLTVSGASVFLVIHTLGKKKNKNTNFSSASWRGKLSLRRLTILSISSLRFWGSVVNVWWKLFQMMRICFSCSWNPKSETLCSSSMPPPTPIFLIKGLPASFFGGSCLHFKVPDPPTVPPSSSSHRDLISVFAVDVMIFKTFLFCLVCSSFQKARVAKAEMPEVHLLW